MSGRLEDQSPGNLVTLTYSSGLTFESFDAA